MDKHGVPPTKRFVFGNRVTYLDSIPEFIRLLGIKHLRVSTAKPTVSTARRKQFVLLNITIASTKSSYYCWFKITTTDEKVNAAESLLVVSTEVNVD
ncbi:hypothetical protein Tco_0418919 [Tanacetum coccineum]